MYDEFKHGTVNQGSMCLTAIEAFSLGDDLIRAAKQAIKLDELYKSRVTLDIQKKVG